MHRSSAFLQCVIFSHILFGNMVVFCCNACGESLKKNKVQQHYEQKCRNCTVLSCMDCGKDFHGDDYAMHTRWAMRVFFPFLFAIFSSHHFQFWQQLCERS